LKANPAYWEGRPLLPGLIIKIIPDGIVRVLELKKGTVDFLQNDIEPDLLPWLQKRTDSKISIIDGTTFQYLGMNLEHPVLRHAGARQAIAQAIDQKSMVTHLLKGLAQPATGLLSPSNWAYEPAVTRWAYDPEEAKRLLEQAGFPDPDGAGPLPRFKLSYKTTSLEFRRRMAEALKEQLSKVGIELEVRSYEWGTFYSDVKKGNFHLYSLSWVGVSDPDIYFDLFHSTSAPPHGNNRGRYRNHQIDELLERGRHSLDPRERKRIYSDVQKILAVELPYVPLWWTKNVVVMKRTLSGFVPYPDGDLISFKNVFLGAPSA
jgi:peptide/nickel transport system substrate-binding protein